MTENRENSNNTHNFFNNFDFLNFSFKQIPNFKKCIELGGKNGIGFEPNPEIYNQLTEEMSNDSSLKTQKILNGTPSNIKVNENTLHHFRFTLCKDYMEYLTGITESKESILNAIQLSHDYVYISQDNFDSDVILFKRGFKTNYSNWTAYTNHLTSDIYFNILFNFYKLGYIEEYAIFYSEPIKNSNSPYIHPLNSSVDQDLYDSDLHPYKRENIKFHNIFHKLNIIITINGFKDIDKLLNEIPGEKSIIYDSRSGIYEKDLEEFIEPDSEEKRGFMGKVNNFLSSDN